tara:strand:+ start:1878 stop:2051 length:174 start_codon:yes stop_codon:yes gene_type:complete
METYQELRILAIKQLIEDAISKNKFVLVKKLIKLKHKEDSKTSPYKDIKDPYGEKNE